MKTLIKILCLSVLWFSCEETIPGCTDDTACNFSSSANSDDNSCFYAEDWEDDCGVCDLVPSNNNSTCILDCNDVWGGNAIVDECGQCVGGNTNRLENYLMDECGVCNGNGIADGECDCDGNLPDECGICGGNNFDMCDYDDDGIANAEDTCPYDPENDIDNDGICAICGYGSWCNDNCVEIYNPDQTDTDTDQIGDSCDECPNDMMNDIDEDGICGDIDSCPNDYYNDIDGDGHCANVDNCSEIYNPDQTDADNDGAGDTCDECPDDINNDIDNNGICDSIEECPPVFDDTGVDGCYDDRESGYVVDADGDYVNELSFTCLEEGQECQINSVNDANQDGICDSDPNGDNFNGQNTHTEGNGLYDEGEPWYYINCDGCTDLYALNYNPEATTDDNSCEYADHSIDVLENNNLEPFILEVNIGETIQWNNKTTELKGINGDIADQPYDLNNDGFIDIWPGEQLNTWTSFKFDETSQGVIGYLEINSWPTDSLGYDLAYAGLIYDCTPESCLIENYSECIELSYGDFLWTTCLPTILIFKDE